MLSLPANWNDIKPDTIYQTHRGKFVAFAKNQIQLGQKYDPNNKHLKAIEKGEVPPRDHVGLVPSEQNGYYLKTKVLGKGGDYRFHAKQMLKSIRLDESDKDKQVYIILFFPGLMTNH